MTKDSYVSGARAEQDEYQSRNTGAVPDPGGTSARRYLGMSPMGKTAKGRDPPEQAARTRRLCEPGHVCSHRDWPDPLTDPGELTPDELDLLQSHVPGHRWDGWRRLTGDEDYVAAFVRLAQS